MHFKITTLVDITNTNARFNKSDPAWLQQQNYLTLLQTIGLRVNPIVDSTRHEVANMKDFEFGSLYKGNNTVWIFNFHIEQLDGTTVALLETDFNNVPIINNLDETINLKQSVFKTKDAEFKNIIFKYVDY
tara:strand:- start:1297 stop:1689 length:393 start_codon:yes stop_codon:yes gene_type:complete